MTTLASALLDGIGHLTADGWDPEKHPRVPAGEPGGGRFGEGVGGGRGGREPDPAFKELAVANEDALQPIHSPYKSLEAPPTLPPRDQPIERAKAVTEWMDNHTGIDTQSVWDKLIENPDGTTRGPNTPEEIRRAYDPERDQLHEDICQKILDDAIAKGATQDGEAIIMGGLPGAGKTTLLKEFTDTDRYVTLNPDDMKEALIKAGAAPQIEGFGAMEAATLIHEESSDMAKMLGNMAISQGYNVVWDVSMGKMSSVEKNIAELRANDYRITGMFVDVPIQQALDGSKQRYADQLLSDPEMARPVPEKNIAGQYDRGSIEIPLRGGQPGETIHSRAFESQNRRVFNDLVNPHDVGTTQMPTFDRSILFDNRDYAKRVVGTTGDPFDRNGQIRISERHGSGPERNPPAIWYGPAPVHAPPSADVRRQRIAASGVPRVSYAHFHRAYRRQLARRDEIEIDLHAHLARAFAAQGRVVHRRLKAIRRQMTAEIPLTAATQPANPMVRRPVAHLRASEVFMDGFDDEIDDQLTEPLQHHSALIGAALVGAGLFGAGAALNRMAQQHVDDTLASVSTSGQTAIRNVEGVLASTYQAGGDYDTMINNVDDLFDTLAGSRSAMIARDATTGLLSGMGTIAARLAGVESQRMWVTMDDDRVRGTNPKDLFDHVEAHGQVVGLDEPFIVSGEELDYPGDPKVSIGNIANCRCWVELVQPEDVNDIPLNDEGSDESA